MSGTAPGTDILWQLSDQSGFLASTFSDAMVDADGNITLTRPMSDDFCDNTIDISKWTSTWLGGLNTQKMGQTLVMKGKLNSSSWWSGYAAIRAHDPWSRMPAGKGVSSHNIFTQ